MRTPLAHARLRRLYAVVACMLWLVGVELLPNVHLESHASGRAHQHAANGTVVTVTFDRDAEHSHGDIVHSHSHATPKAKRKAPRDVLAIDRVPDLHVATGLAHRAVALHEAPPPVIDAIAIDRVITELVALATGRSTIAFIATADARGPPHV